MREGARAGSPQYNRRENKVGEGSIDQGIIWRRADRRPALRSNNSSRPAALTELKVKIQAEPESDFFAPTLSKVIRVESATARSTLPPKRCMLESPSVSSHDSPFTMLAIHNPSQRLYC